VEIEELKRLHHQERNSTVPQELPSAFYPHLGEWVRTLKDERERAIAESEYPLESERVHQLSEQLAEVQRLGKGIHERRIAKLIRLLGEQSGIPAENLTPAEHALYEAIVDELAVARRAVLEDTGVIED